MAKQKGIIKLDGTIGDITFFKTSDGYLAKEKSGPTADQIANDPSFQRTRENGKEFGRAGKASKVLRNAVRSLIQNAEDSRAISRLVKEMMKVIKADTTSKRGMRNVIDGETELLEGFDFNVNSKLGTTLYAPYSVEVDRGAGTLTLKIPSFKPTDMIAAPAGATHFKIVSAGSAIDFEQEVSTTDIHESAMLPWDGTGSDVMDVIHTLEPASTHPLFLVLGIQFFQDVNGEKYPLKNGAFNALNLVKVSG